MGYWFAPSPKAFEPVARPLGYSIQNGIYVPDTLDTPLLGMIGKTALGKSIGPAKAYDLLLRMRPPPNVNMAFALDEQIGGWGSKTITMTRWVYGDLPDGGLPADTVNPDGTLTTNYWDLSDGARPYRKCRTAGYGPKGEPWQRIMFWDPDKGWQDEGMDVERDLVVHFNEIMNVIFILIRMVASATGVGAPAAAIMGIMFDGWKLASSQIQVAGWEPPSEPLNAEGVFMSLGGNFIGLAAEIGRTDAFGKLANEAQKSFVSLMTSAGAYPMIKGLGELGGSLMSIEKQLEKYLAGTINVTGSKEATLKFDLDDVMKYGSELVNGNETASMVIQVKSEIASETEADPMQLPISDYRRVMWNAAVFGYMYPDEILRIRRNAIWNYRIRSTPLSPSEQSVQARGIEESLETALECGTAFDGFISQMYANKRAPLNPMLLAIKDAWDPQATATYKQVLARGKQSAAIASDKSATMTFRQALAKMQQDAPAAPPSTPAKERTDYSGLAAAAALLYALSKVVR